MPHSVGRHSVLQVLKTGLNARTHAHTDRQTDRQTKVKTVYPPVSLRSLGGYNYNFVMLCTSGFVDDVMFYTMDSMARHLYSVTVETTPLSIPAIKTSNYTSWVARMGGGQVNYLRLTI